jgi:hypothetical protein
LLDGSRMSREVHVRLCDQKMQVWTVGDRPTEVKVRSLVAWIAGRREIEFPKPITAHEAVSRVAEAIVTEKTKIIDLDLRAYLDPSPQCPLIHEIAPVDRLLL